MGHSAFIFIPKKKALCFFETSGNPNPATQRNILEDLNLNNNNVEITTHLAKVNNFVLEVKIHNVQDLYFLIPEWNDRNLHYKATQVV